ncbi:MAG TPA: phosphatidate cytidylyltransferase [Ktedonobacteraceae bacterium]|nr:phosphatidate cytidylyltransferase [Ktedonobacteraceae bacterium]
MQPVSEEETQTNAPVKDNRQWNRSVGQRVITAVIAIPVVLAFVWFSGWAGFAVAILVVILSVYELHNMMVHEGYHPLIWMSFALSILFLLAAMFPQQRLLLLEVGLSAALLITLPLLFIRKKLDGAMVDWSLTLAIPIYLGWPMSVFLLLRGFQGGITPGFWWILTVFLGVWGFDTGAFFSGHFFGKHKLAPAISPAKTWEGVSGGLVFSIVAALICTTWTLGVPWYLAILLGILIGIAATLGDLAESLIKRQTHVKDSGQFMPGHGGILDRIDSLLFAVVVVFLFAQVVGKL